MPADSAQGDTGSHHVEDMCRVTLAEAAGVGTIRRRVNCRVRLASTQQVQPHPRHPYGPAFSDSPFEIRGQGREGGPRRERVEGAGRRRGSIAHSLRSDPFVTLSSDSHAEFKSARGPARARTLLTSPVRITTRGLVSLRSTQSHVSTTIVEKRTGRGAECKHVFVLNSRVPNPRVYSASSSSFEHARHRVNCH
jgi:hypothetical protein